MTILELYKRYNSSHDLKETQDVLALSIGLYVISILQSFPNRSFTDINDLLHYEFGVEEPEWYQNLDFKTLAREWEIWNEGKDDMPYLDFVDKSEADIWLDENKW